MPCKLTTGKSIAGRLVGFLNNYFSFLFVFVIFYLFYHQLSVCICCRYGDIPSLVVFNCSGRSFDFRQMIGSFRKETVIQGSFCETLFVSDFVIVFIVKLELTTIYKLCSRAVCFLNLKVIQPVILQLYNRGFRVFTVCYNIPPGFINFITFRCLCLFQMILTRRNIVYLEFSVLIQS